MKKTGCLWVLLLMLTFGNTMSAHAQNDYSIIIAIGQDVPTEDGLPEGYGFPEGYQENAVQFVTEDGVALCGYVLGTGSRGITLGHARGWGLKSWLPFGERLAEEGYQVILWEFRDIAPSGSAAAGMSQRWDLDVLAAAQVLRERRVTEIIAMGASYGGTATAVAAAEIPELVGVVILSAPAHGMEIDAISAMESVTAPAFFAVSREDWQNAPGVYQEHVESLYEACRSDQKEIHIAEGSDHGTDMITVPEEGELGYAVLPKTQEERKAREELADELMRFVNEAFGEDKAAEETAVSQDAAAGSLMPSTGKDTAGSEEVLQEKEPADSMTASQEDKTAGMPEQIRDGRDVPQSANNLEADSDAEEQTGDQRFIFWSAACGISAVAVMIILTAIIRRRHFTGP